MPHVISALSLLLNTTRFALTLFSNDAQSAYALLKTSLIVFEPESLHQLGEKINAVNFRNVIRKTTRRTDYFGLW